MQRQRQETSTVTQGIQLCSAGPEQQSCAVLLPKGQQGFGHRDSSQRWKTKRQITSENNGKQELFILDTSQGLENMKVKKKEKRFLNIWRWKTKVLVGCERKNRVIRTQILMAHRMTWRKRHKTHSICSGELIASSQLRIQSKWQSQNWVLFCNCRMWIVSGMATKQRVNTSREHGCKKETLKWRGFKQQWHLSLLTLIFFPWILLN